MKILVFEYSTVLLDNILMSEGVNMLKSILSDLNDVEDYSVDYIVSDNLSFDEFPNCNVIHVDDLFSWLDVNCKYYDCCLFIAPEDDLIQYKITLILEKHEIPIIGSNSSASYTCTSKSRTYDEIPDNILKVPSKIINVNNIDYENINSILKKKKLIIKPDNRTSSDLIYKFNDIHQLKKIIKKYEKEDVLKALIQEYIPGNSISVSTICNNDHIDIISINSQEIKENTTQIEYTGCKTPIQHPLKKEIIEQTKKILTNIPGLRGFVGVDYIIHDKNIYFIEINSRITTPYIVLHELTDENLTKTLIENLLNNESRKIKIKSTGYFYK